jgi:drug/metabolite transporter (DMT)-like permease
VMDGIGKYLAMYAAMSPAQVSFYRFFIQMILTAMLVVGLYGFAALRPNRLWLNVVRGFLIGVSSFLFFWAIKYIPLADAMAIFFVEPFILTALSAFFLGERVGWRRWSAIVVGFIGALIVIQPSFAVFGVVSLLPVGTAALVAVYLLMNRALGTHDKPLVMQFVAGASASALMGAVLAFGWGAGAEDFMPSLPISGFAFMLVLAMAAIATLGHVMVVQAFQIAPASLLAPFQYVEIITAVLVGVWVFSDVPSLSKVVGIVVIIGSGLFIFWREQQVKED